jgi:hypothetical protein
MQREPSGQLSLRGRHGTHCPVLRSQRGVAPPQLTSAVQGHVPSQLPASTANGDFPFPFDDDEMQPTDATHRAISATRRHCMVCIPLDGCESFYGGGLGLV